MRSLLSFARSGAPESVDRAIGIYEARCGGGEVSLAQCWERLRSSYSPSTLAALVKLDLERRFGLGERPRVAEYLERFPVLAESGDRVVSLVYEEFCLLQECGEDPDSREFCEAYGPWSDSLRSQLVYHRELSQIVGKEGPAVNFPSPGERFDKYQLQSLLGKGGVAQVYLATEDDLGGRKLAIKVSSSFGQEPLILAKLDHQNIVPILTVAHSETGLIGICMPYRPGVTLEQLIRRVGRGTPPRSARAIWDSLKPGEASEVLPADGLRSGWADFPIGETFSEAVAWIGLALSDALAYLHGRGVFHRDIKPANVLLAYREGPQLLDFNLAQDPGAPEHVHAALNGGTLPYMAPEQLRAFLDPSGWDDVGRAADLYSLGLVLKELVTGRPPDVPSTEGSPLRGIQTFIDRRLAEQPSIREINPAVPPSLASIIEKCLAVEPSDRYEGASGLAEDLRLFLARRPLRHADNPSKVERAINWVHRNPLVSIVAVSLVLAASLVLGLMPPSMMNQIEKGEALLDSRHPEDHVKARATFERLCQEYRDSAWPKLYLSLTLDKLRENPGEAYNLIQKACEMPDAEEALTGRLGKASDSTNLLTNLGLVLINKGEHSRAEPFLVESLRLDESNFVTLNALADVERKLQNTKEAIRLYSRAAQVGEARKEKRGTIYAIHTALLPLYLKQADGIMDVQPTDRQRALDCLAQWEATLEAFQRDWGLLVRPPGTENHNFHVEFYEGCLASFQAALAAESPGWPQAAELFEKARRRFDSANHTLSTELQDDQWFRRLFRDQEKKLEDRLKKYCLSPKVGAAASDAGK